MHNTGAAFGFLNARRLSVQDAWLLAGRRSAALAGLAVYAATLDRSQRLTRFGLALVIGGAAGNLIDRFTAGYVLDFVDLYWRRLAFLGVQRRRLGDYRRRGADDPRAAWPGTTRVSRAL